MPNHVLKNSIATRRCCVNNFLFRALKNHRLCATLYIGVSLLLSQKLVELRNKREYTHDYLSQYLKITRQAYSFYESGKREMNFESLCMLADLYNVTTDYLLGRSDVTNAPYDDEEIGIIRTYRSLDNRAKETIKNYLSFEASRIEKDKAAKKTAM